MTPRQLERAGQRLFGPQWQSALARALGFKNVTSVQAYMRADRTRPIPLYVERHCQLLLKNPEMALDLGLSPKTKRDRKL